MVVIHTPTLIEPCFVELQAADPANTEMDDLAREPVRTLARKVAIQIEAQVSWGHTIQLEYHQGGHGGHVEDADGYFVFIASEVASVGGFEINMRVNKIAAQTGTWYLVNRLLAGHHSGVATLEIWDFSSRPLSRT